MLADFCVDVMVANVLNDINILDDMCLSLTGYYGETTEEEPNLTLLGKGMPCTGIFSPLGFSHRGQYQAVGRFGRSNMRL